MNSQPQIREGISVIIVSYNAREVLSSCLDSVIHSGEGLDIPYEIIVVDNDSKDGTLGLLKPRYPEITWISSPVNSGFGRACNRGGVAAGFSLLLFLNPDTIVEKNTLAAMVELFRHKDNIGAAGCRIENPDHSLQLACRRSFPTPKVAGYKFLGLSRLFPKSRTYGRYNLTYLDENEEQEVDAVSGSFLCIQKKLFHQVKGFDEDFFMYGEDLDLCYRVKLLGKKNYYTPETTILHFKGESAKSRPIRSLFHFYSAMIIFSRKHFELRTLPLFMVYTGALGLGTLNFFSSRLKKWQRWSLDLAVVNAILSVITFIYSNYRGVPHIFSERPFLYLTWHGLLSILILFFMGYSGDYGKTVQNLRSASIAGALAVLSFFTFGYFFYEGSFSRIVLGISGIVSFICLTGWRAIASKGSILLGRFTASSRRAVIVGINARSLQLRDLIVQGYLPGYEFIGFVREQESETGSEVRTELVCELDAISSVLKTIEIHEIIISLNANVYQTALQILSMDLNSRVSVKILVGEPKPRSITLIDLNYSRKT